MVPNLRFQCFQICGSLLLRGVSVVLCVLPVVSLTAEVSTSPYSELGGEVFALFLSRLQQVLARCGKPLAAFSFLFFYTGEDTQVESCLILGSRFGIEIGKRLLSSSLLSLALSAYLHSHVAGVLVVRSSLYPSWSSLQVSLGVGF
ncbi:unnamed protein product [Microthlaspi erraticum]|uniref:Uncharacterized protein n=1 Tax=Microthlaspi erraticum TaxID=1685480 RepID=A0A6D2HMP3_9BRAS|nr:unnamed protein product [Microthlaspi erraticum]